MHCSNKIKRMCPYIFYIWLQNIWNVLKSIQLISVIPVHTLNEGYGDVVEKVDF